MIKEILLNQIGFPKIAELSNQGELPGIGEKIHLERNSSAYKIFEVTEVKRDLHKDTVYIYVNSIK